MAQSFCKFNVHIIFGTKERRNIITDDIKDDIYKYIIGISKKLDCYVIEIGGTECHIHILTAVSKNITVPKYIENIKSGSSRLIRDKHPELDFAWQIGYGAFSVSESNINIVRKYIQNQKEHHKKRSYYDEFVAFLKLNDIEFDEDYILK